MGPPVDAVSPSSGRSSRASASRVGAAGAMNLSRKTDCMSDVHDRIYKRLAVTTRMNVKDSDEIVSGARLEGPGGRFLGLLRAVALVAMVGGAVGSVGLML